MTSIRAGVHFDIRVSDGDIVSFQKDGMASPRIGQVHKIERVIVASPRGVSYNLDTIYIRSHSNHRFDECTCEPLHILQRIAE